MTRQYTVKVKRTDPWGPFAWALLMEPCPPKGLGLWFAWTRGGAIRKAQRKIRRVEAMGDQQRESFTVTKGCER